MTKPTRRITTTLKSMKNRPTRSPASPARAIDKTDQDGKDDDRQHVARRHGRDRIARHHVDQDLGKRGLGGDLALDQSSGLAPTPG
jgi:hypothetical protein